MLPDNARFVSCLPNSTIGASKRNIHPPHFQYPCNGESVGGYGKKIIFADGRTIGASAAGNAEYLLK